MKEINELRAGQLTFQGEVLHLMKNIIEDKKLPFDIRQELIDKKRKRPDLIVTVFKDSEEKKYCFIEIEDPGASAYDSSFVDKAGHKAYRHGVEYFATWTVNEFVLWNTWETDTPLMERKHTYFDKNSVGLDAPTYGMALQKKGALSEFLRKFLKHLHAIYLGIEQVEKPILNEFFIRFLNSVINPLSLHVAKKMGEDLHKDPEFRKKFSKWLRRERISGPSASILGTERAARQFSYMLLDKIIFYNVLRSRGEPLLPILIHENLSGEDTRRTLRGKFDDVTNKIDYEPIFLTDFVDDLPIPDEVVPLLCRFVSELDRYDPSEIGGAIGTIFQGVIPEKDRHVLGQYFTRSDVVDLIVGFCLRDPKSVVLDPACGAGTFLVRSYYRIKYLDPSRDHDKILSCLTGVDISKFPSHLSTMSLVLKDTKARLNYPFVLHRDFFELTPKRECVIEIPRRKVELTGAPLLGPKTERYGVGFIRLSRKLGGCDVVVTNPPYTRQEEMEKLEFPRGYRERLKGLIEEEWNLPIGKRSSIYSHFFFHGGKFLKEGGKLGLITSNSWLDVDYGKYLQEFFLRNFKIVAVIESKLERWFEDADINTAITILERCGDEERRNENLVKFVQLKRPLREFVPLPDEGDGWEEVDKLVERIEAANAFVEDDRIRIFTKKQGELWSEGFLDGKYRGSKWGKYLRAPRIFFKILEKGKDLFVPLGEVAEVRFGIKTGANEFFYLTEEQISDWGIEKEFWMHKENGRWVPNYVIKSPRECKSVIVNPKDLRYRVLMIHKDKRDLKETNVLRYIERGEEQGFHKRPTCASRPRWYELEKIRAQILSRRFIDTTFDFFVNPDVFVGDTFFCVYLKRGDSKALSSILNSSLYSFLVEAYGRTVMGQGVLLMYGPEIAPLPVYDLSKLQTSQIQKLEKAFEKLSERPIGPIFEEIGTEKPEEVSLDKVKPDRRELDRIVMGEILGLTEDEQLEVYRAVVDLVRSRIEKARSVKRKL